MNQRIVFLAAGLIGCSAGLGPTCQAQEYSLSKVLVESSTSIVDLAVSVNGLHLAYIVSYPNQVTILSMQDGKVLRVLDKLPESPRQVSFLAKRPVVVIACDSGIMIWNFQTGETTFHKMPGCCLTAQYSPDGKFLANSFDAGVVLWDAVSGDHLKTFFHHPGLVSEVRFSRDSELLASCCDKGQVRVYNVLKKELLVSKVFDGEQTFSLAFSPKADLLCIGTVTNLIIWDFYANKEVARIKGFRLFQSICPNSNGKNLFAALNGADEGGKSLVLVDIAAKTLAVVKAPKQHYVSVVQMLPDESLLIGYGAHDPGVRKEKWGGIEILIKKNKK